MDVAAVTVSAAAIILTLIGAAWALGQKLGGMTRQLDIICKNYGELLIIVGKLSDRMYDVEAGEAPPPHQRRT